MKNRILITCIIPTYNETADQVERALLSVLKSSYPVHEIIVVDDGSPCATSRSVVSGLSEKNDIRILYHRQDNFGPSTARNAGGGLSSCEWLLFLDADDFLLPNGLQSKINEINTLGVERLGGVYGSFVWSTTNKAQPFRTGGPVRADHVGVIGKVPGGAPAYLIRKKAFTQVGGFDTSLMFNEDFDLILRMMSVGYDFYGIDEPGFVRVISECSHSRKNKTAALAGNRLFLIKAWRQNLMSKREVLRRLFINAVGK